MTCTRSTTRRTAVAMVSTAVVLGMTGCSLIGQSSGEGGGDDGDDPGVVRVVTHDSFAVSEDLIADLEDDTGYTVELSAPGDGGALVNQLILTKDSPLGDVAYGVDNSFARRASAEGALGQDTSAERPAEGGRA